MNAAEEKRLADARELAKTAPESEHVEFQWKDADTFLCCVKCGFIKPRTGWPKPCRGWVRISLRGSVLR